MFCIRIFNDIDETTLTLLTRELDEVSDGSEITIQICSAGGYVFDAFGIIDYLKKRRFITRCEILGMAASAAAIIALSCDKVEMAEYASIMLHSAYANYVGEKDNSIDQGIIRANELQLQIIQKRCPNYTLEELNKEKWFDAKTAKSLGLVDEIINNNNQIVALCNAYLASLKGEQTMAEKIDEKQVVEEKVAECGEDVKAEEAPSIEDIIEVLNKRLEEVEHRLAVLEGEGKKEDDELKEESDGEDAVYARRKALYAKINKLASAAPAPAKASAKKSKINIRNFLD